MRKTLVLCLLAGATVLLFPLVARAQGSIVGSVKDPSGAVLPGVTVEASSPALIEKARSVVTDAAGKYQIIDLPPGTYAVNFTLTGFKTVRREDIIIQGTFSAPVNAEMQVGNLAETITVTGASPTVDVNSNQAHFVVDRDILDQIPTPIRNTPLRALLLPGTTVVPFVLGQYTMAVHGSSSSDTVIAIDGLRVNNLCGSGQYSGFYMNDSAIEEVTFTTGAESAEMQSGGMRINSTPKDGGNSFSGTMFFYGAGSGLQADNRTDAMKLPSGPTAIPKPGIAYTWQINPAFGGPLKRDKLWFYFTYKYEDFKTYVPSSAFADGSRAFRQGQGSYSAVTRLTYQASKRDKIRLYIDRQFNGEDYNGFNTLPTTTPEASTDAFGRGWVPQIKWTQTTTNKLLLDAGLSYYTQYYEQQCRDEAGPLPILEQTTNRLSVRCGSTIPPYTSWTKSYSGAASASYITGSHAFKGGITTQWGTNSRTFDSAAQINTLVTNAGLLGLPTSVTGLPIPCTSLPCPVAVLVENTPATAEQKVKSDIGVFVQDAWTMNRLTLNLGARYDHFNAEVPAQSSPAPIWPNITNLPGAVAPAPRNFPAIEDVPNWNDFSIRLAGAYDVFGTGKTAFKANASKYIAAAAAGYAQNFNPMTYCGSCTGATRQWIDFDGNKSILDSAGNIQFNEVFGGTANFGAITNRRDPDLLRGYNWEYSASVQHQLMDRVSVTAGYYRRNFYNLDVTDNLNLAVSDWSPFQITGPADTRLPRSGERITMYTLNPAKNGTPTDNLRTFSGDNHTVYNGVELSGNFRREKLLLFGGVTTDKRATTTCDERDNPNSSRFCDAVPPFRTTYKISGAYQLPYEFQLSGSFIATPGPSVNANYTVTAAIAGRSILGSTGNATTINVNLAEPNTIFLDYKKQLDLRIARSFRFGSKTKIQGFMDLFNALNSGTVLRVNEAYGSNPATNQWMTPTAIMEARYVRFGMQMSF